MTAIHARNALLPSGWARDVRLTIDAGSITAVEPRTQPRIGDERVPVLIPGVPNLHSHAFQRGMAGLAEVGGPQSDSFWTWRELMYRFALEIDPDQLEALAGLLYIEQLEAGFTRVGEFHYLHHDRDGSPYADIGEMAARIVAAAETSGIRLTLLPTFYAHGGFGGQPPTARQRRFLSDLDQFQALVSRSRELISGLDGAVLGVAPHSLRAVTAKELAAVVALHPQGPIHIHAAEQTEEVNACLAWSGQRPVAWLLDHADIDERWCLIHATHLDDAEIERLARSGAVVGLCPITEANLGDGIFAGRDFRIAGGSFGIGTDSNVQIDAASELRQLEYSQRLARRERNVLSDEHRSTARVLFEAALAGGRQALGAESSIQPGAPADLVALASDRVDLDDGDRALSAWVFTGHVRVESVWVNGDQVVVGGRHRNRDEAIARFRAAMRSLVGS